MAPLGVYPLNSFHVSSLFGARPEDAKTLKALANIPSRDNETAKLMRFRGIESSEWVRSKGPIAL